MKRILLITITLMLLLTGCSGKDDPYLQTELPKDLQQQNDNLKDKYGMTSTELLDKMLESLDKEENRNVKSTGVEEQEMTLYFGEISQNIKEKDTSEVVYKYYRDGVYDIARHSALDDFENDEVTKSSNYIFSELNKYEVYSYDSQENVWVLQSQNEPYEFLHASQLDLLYDIVSNTKNLFVFNEDYVEIDGTQGIALTFEASGNEAIAIGNAYDLPHDTIVTHQIDSEKAFANYKITYTVVVDAETFLPLQLSYDATKALQALSQAVIDFNGGKTSDVVLIKNTITFNEIGDSVSFELPKEAKENPITYDEYLKLVGELE